MPILNVENSKCQIADGVVVAAMAVEARKISN